MIFDAANPESRINREATPFDLLEQGVPSVESEPIHLIRVGAELLLNRLPETGWGEALLYLPVGIGDEFRRYVRRVDTLKGGEWGLAIADQGGSHTTLHSLGKFTGKHSLRRDLTAIIVREDLCAVLAARPIGDGKQSNGRWKSVLSLAPSDVKSAANLISGTLRDRMPDVAYAAESLAAKVEQYKRNYDPIKHSRIIGPIITELSANREPKVNRHDAELRWQKILGKVYDAVSWELDSQKLNQAVAKVLKKSIGYDYLELQWFQRNGEDFVPAGAFQKNDTTFGGPLLTVILRPEKMAEILRNRQPFLISEDTGSEVLMNPRLLTFMGLQSGILVPLNFQRRPNGLLKIFSKRTGSFGVDSLDQMDELGRIIAKSIENARTHSAMRRMATVDGLTNVYNHRFFTEQITREFKRARRYESSLTLLMLDIDHFKNYNDTYGHLQGDKVLTEVAEIIKNNVREVDLTCRYGGEEFTIILPETDISQGQVVAEKIRKAVEESRTKLAPKVAHSKVTVSIGIALLTSDVESPSEFVNRADMALYRAKKLGRNRCEAY